MWNSPRYECSSVALSKIWVMVTSQSRGREASLLAWFRQAELLDAIAHLIAIDAEQMTGLGLVAAGALERLNHQLPLDGLEVDALGRKSERCGRRAVRDNVAKSSTPSRPLSASSIARSIALRSSRTLPGQRY